MHMNSDEIQRFREAFNRVENYLRRKGNYSDWRDFAYMLKEQSAKDINLRQYIDELGAMRELRNILFHREGVDTAPFAIPSQKTVERLEQIVANITTPPTVESQMVAVLLLSLPRKIN